MAAGPQSLAIEGDWISAQVNLSQTSHQRNDGGPPTWVMPTTFFCLGGAIVPAG